jgi:hypothetical protein
MSHPEVEARARELLRIAMAEKTIVAAPFEVPAGKPAVTPPDAVAPAGTPGAQPTAVPPGAITVADGSSTKWQRLAELTELYMADKVTPREYHEQRAKIIAGQ